MTVPSLTEKLSAHLMRSPNESDRDRSRLHLLDWLGCVAGARRSAVANVMRSTADDVLIRAAMLGNVLEMDDVHRAAILHPGPAVWPAALLAHRDAGGAMAALLDGAIKGYEAMIAIGATFDAAHYAFFHNSGTAGGFGAAAASGAIFGLDVAQMTSALGNAGSVAGGLWQMRHEAVMTKQMHLAQAVRTGVWQAQLARHGFSGVRYILEGPQGLYAATCRVPKPMRLKDHWRIVEVSFKPWGACRHAHPAIDAALDLKARGGLCGDIRVETYADAIAFCDRPDPKTVHEAKFSIQHAVAIVMERGEPQLADFEPEAIAQLASARASVTVAEGTDFTGRYPDHFGARITTGADEAVLIDTRGDPERSLSRQGVLAKARELMAWGELDERETEVPIDLALNSDDPSEITKMLERWLS